MKYHISILLIPLFTLSCTYYWVKGPVPADTNYLWSVNNIPDYNEVVYIIHGNLFPGIILDDALSFGKRSIDGVFFITPSSIIFAMYNSASQKYYAQEIFHYLDITWISVKEHGLSRIISFKIKELKGSIIFVYSITPDGEKADKDIVINYISHKVLKKI